MIIVDILTKDKKFSFAQISTIEFGEIILEDFGVGDSLHMNNHVDLGKALTAESFYKKLL